MRYITFVLVFFTMFAVAQPQIDKKSMHKFAIMMHKKHHFIQQDVENILLKNTINTHILKLMSRPYEAMPWQTYLRHFITPNRLAGGVATWHRYRNRLRKIERDYHVPASIIVAIMGMESNYGAHQATHNALRTLTTLSFAYPKRSKFFTSELENLFLLAREQHFDVKTLRGSYAGALGMPQFMPSSYRRYAIDSDHHQHANLFTSIPDTLESIANYLHHFGWNMNQPILSHPQFSQNNLWHFTPLTHQPNLSPQVLHQNFNLPKNTPPLRPIRFDSSIEGAWLAWPNFTCLHHYNRSDLYGLTAALFATYLTKAYQHAYPSDQHI